jgi:hypothetical protein
VAGVGEAGRGAVTRLEQRSAVAFAFMAAAVVVALLILLWGCSSERPKLTRSRRAHRTFFCRRHLHPMCGRLQPMLLGEL